ncbi:MAG: Ig-like domain repeat protein, partial [Clostridia bacterium]|nr:Ig-like domain repeat protein [Clostridia bacterium]
MREQKNYKRWQRMMAVLLSAGMILTMQPITADAAEINVSQNNVAENNVSENMASDNQEEAVISVSESEIQPDVSNVTGEADNKIKANDLNISVSQNEVVFSRVGGCKPSVTVMNGETVIPMEGNYSISYITSGGWSEANPWSADTYSIEIEFNQDKFDVADFNKKIGTFIIKKKPLTGKIIGNTTKVYNDNNTVTDEQKQTLSVELSGLEGVDQETVFASADTYLYNSKNAGENLTITARNVGLHGDGRDNYVLVDNEGEVTTTLTTSGNILKRPAYISPARTLEKSYGYPDHNWFYFDVESMEGIESGLTGGDSLEGEMAREEGEDVGTYAFTKGTLHNANYEVIMKEGANQYTIKKADIDFDFKVSPTRQRPGLPVTFTITSQNQSVKETTLAPGIKHPEQVTLKTENGTSISVNSVGDGIWTAEYILPSETTNTLKFVAQVKDETGNYNVPEPRDVYVDCNDSAKYDTEIELTPDINWISKGKSQKYTAVVTKGDPKVTEKITGKVQFYFDEKEIGAPQDVTRNPSITFTKANLTEGRHRIHAKYLGDENFNEAECGKDIDVKPDLKIEKIEINPVEFPERRYSGKVYQSELESMAGDNDEFRLRKEDVTTGTYVFKLMAVPRSGDDQKVSSIVKWSSSNASIATVKAQGNQVTVTVKKGAVGGCFLTATAQDSSK